MEHILIWTNNKFPPIFFLLKVFFYTAFSFVRNYETHLFIPNLIFFPRFCEGVEGVRGEVFFKTSVIVTTLNHTCKYAGFGYIYFLQHTHHQQ